MGAAICVASLAVAIAHIYFGYIKGAWGVGALAFALPVTAGVLVIAGLGFWLGWIMATTKEVAPAPVETLKSEEEKTE